MPAEENPGTRGVLLVSLGTLDSPSVADVRCYLDEWCRTYQSRLGAKQWLQPYTSGQLALLAKAGAGSVQLAWKRWRKLPWRIALSSWRRVASRMTVFPVLMTTRHTLTCLQNW